MPELDKSKQGRFSNESRPSRRKRGTVWATRAHVRLIEPRTSKHSPGGLAFWARWKDIGNLINKTKQNKKLLYKLQTRHYADVKVVICLYIVNVSTSEHRNQHDYIFNFLFLKSCGVGVYYKCAAIFTTTQKAKKIAMKKG